MARLYLKLFTPVDNGPLVLFRALFGLLLFLESSGAILTGWVAETFVEVQYNFTFIGFEWLSPPPGPWMYGYYTIMAVLGLMVMAGWHYRFSISAFTLMWSASYLMQKSHYNNHYYLLILLCVFMMISPAHQQFSVDSRRNPSLKSLTCPAWCYWIFIIQLFIVYEAAALSKIYPDWLNGDPIGIWLSAKADFPLFGEMFQQRWWHLLVSYGGIVFDALVIPALFWHRTRNVTFVVSIFFHLHNSLVLEIGIFPYLMMASSLLFFPPQLVNGFFFPKRTVVSPGTNPGFLAKPQQLLLLGFAMFFGLQLLLPLRHHLYPGNVHWTEEGHRLAWKMMLRAKSGLIHFRIVDPRTNESTQVDLKQYLSRNQQRKMATRPDMIWQFVQLLKKDYQSEQKMDVEIYASSQVRLNARPRAAMIDPTVNLAQVEWYPFRHADWLLPVPDIAEPKPKD